MGKKTYELLAVFLCTSWSLQAMRLCVSVKNTTGQKLFAALRGTKKDRHCTYEEIDSGETKNFSGKAFKNIKGPLRFAFEGDHHDNMDYTVYETPQNSFFPFKLKLLNAFTKKVEIQELNQNDCRMRILPGIMRKIVTLGKAQPGPWITLNKSRKDDTEW